MSVTPDDASYWNQRRWFGVVGGVVAVVVLVAVIAWSTGSDEFVAAPTTTSDPAVTADSASDSTSTVGSSSTTATSNVETTKPSVSDPATEDVAPSNASVGWSELEPWPLERRSDFPQIWTGTELIVWGGLQEDSPRSFGNGARYNLSAEHWTTLSASPLTPRSRHVGVWTGSEVVYWGGITGDADEPETVAPLSDGAAYKPTTDTWRMLTESPLDGGSQYDGAWTGDQVILVGPEEDAVASYDPSLDKWAVLPPRPPQDHSTDWISAFWTGHKLVVVTSNADQARVDVYNPETNTWRSMPATPFETMEMSVTSGSPTHAIDDSTVWLSGFAPQDDGIVGLDIDTEEWMTSPPFPSGDCDHIPTATSTGNGLLLESCGITAILANGDRWEEIPDLPRTLPKLPGPDPVWTGDHLLLLEAGIEPGAANFPDAAEPHLWVSDLDDK